MDDRVVASLRCPHGDASLAFDGRTLRCPAGHRFDLARQGYVNLLRGAAPAGVETGAMVSARAEIEQAGHHGPLTSALVRTVADPPESRADPTESRSDPPESRADPPESRAAPPGSRSDPPESRADPRLVVDVGAGTGHHLAAVVEAAGQRCAGLAVDLSKHAARRAARAHPRIGAVVADVWADLPVRDDVADVVLVVFAPRNAAEIGRILRPGGVLIVVTPVEGHLAPLVDRLGLLGTQPAKLDHLDDQLAEVVELEHREQLIWHRALDRAAVAALVASGPNAWHTAPGELAHHLEAMDDPVRVTFAVTISTYRRGTPRAP